MSTAELEIRLDTGLEGTGVEHGAVAQVVAFDGAGRRMPKRDRRDVVIPAGVDTTPRTLVVDAGTYLVEAELPGGETVSVQVQAPAGSRVPVELRAAAPARDQSPWQHLRGNVPRGSVSPRWAARGTPSPAAGEAAVPVPGPGGTGLRAPATGGEAAGQERAGPEQAAELGGPSAPPTAPVVGWPAVAPPALAGSVPGEDAWRLLDAAIQGGDPLQTLGFGAVHPVAPTTAEQDGALVRLGTHGSVGWAAQDPNPGPPVPRRYVLATAGDVLELSVVPVPWALRSGHHAAVDTLVRTARMPGEAVLSMAPMDPDAGSLLAYMASGSLVAARHLLDGATGMLHGKITNPLAAAAGGYVLLATAEAADDGAWHSWVRNLSERYSWLPDGAIQLGRLLLRHRRSGRDVDDARTAFLEAAHRGLPYYSLGLQWLVDGLSLLATVDDEAAHLLPRVRAVTWRANLREPFTTIRLAGQ